ncbi:MAG: sensor histidine kinase, partial [Thermoanaerobaculia bacterium]
MIVNRSARNLAFVVAATVALLPGARATASDRPHFERIGMEEGLPHENVYGVAQDRLGFIWFATEDGLARWDGETMLSYDHDRSDTGSVASNDVSRIIPDGDGSLWIGTWGDGLDRFDPLTEAVTHFRRRENGGEAGLPDNRIQSLIATDDAIWIGTRGAGLARLDRATATIQIWNSRGAQGTALRDDRVWSIAASNANTIWIGTDTGLQALDLKSGTITFVDGAGEHARALEGQTIRSLTITRDGTLWLGTPTGAWRLAADRSTLTPVVRSSEAARVAEGGVNTIHEDGQGVVWIGTMQEGLYRFDPSTGAVSRFVHDPQQSWSLGSNDVRWLYEDRSSILWIATRGGGVSRIDLKPHKFTTWTWDPSDADGLAARGVSAILGDASGTLWVGTHDGLDRLERGATAFRHVTTRDGAIPHGDVEVLTEDREGRLWIGLFRAGLCLFDRASNRCSETWSTRSSAERALRDDSVRALLVARDGTLWIGTAGGLHQLDPKTGAISAFVNDPFDPASLSDSYVLALHEDARGRIWIGTDSGGLNLLDPKAKTFRSWKRSKAGDSLPSDRVREVFESRDGTLWIGTSNGLVAFDPERERFKRLDPRPALDSSNIQSVQEDETGRLWVSTANGLSVIDPKSGISRTYNAGDGLQGNIFFPGSSWKAGDGTLYFGGVAGLSAFNPDGMPDNRVVPNVVITRVNVFANPGKVTRPPWTLREIELHHRENFFAIEFAALDFTAPERNRYLFRLEGLSDEWRDAGTQRFANYTAVPPGRYTFRVRGSNNDGVWNEEGASLVIVVKPPFWQAIWFRVALAALALALFVAMIRMRTRTIELQKMALERVVDERTRDLRATTDRLATINSLVESMNAEINFDRVLQMILGVTRFLHGVEIAIVFVYDKSSDLYRAKAALGWDPATVEEIALPADELERLYTAEADEVQKDVFLADRSAQSAAFLTLLTLRLRGPERVEGYLVFEAPIAKGGIAPNELELLVELRGHILSAFMKAKVLEELERLNKSKNEFLGIAAHDLRNPLGVIVGWVSMVIDQLRKGNVDTERAAGQLVKARTAAESMARLVNDLLDISAIESGAIALERDEVDLGAMITATVANHEDAAARKSITLTAIDVENLPLINADSVRIGEVLDNLLSNAIKYTQQGGTVRVSCERLENEIVTHVEDNGQGLGEDDLKEVFHTFKKLSARPTGGETSTGLGLAIVKRIVEIHGGNIWITSAKGEGARFS